MNTENVVEDRVARQKKLLAALRDDPTQLDLLLMQNQVAPAELVRWLGGKKFRTALLRLLRLLRCRRRMALELSASVAVNILSGKMVTAKETIALRACNDLIRAARDSKPRRGGRRSASAAHEGSHPSPIHPDVSPEDAEQLLRALEFDHLSENPTEEVHHGS